MSEQDYCGCCGVKTSGYWCAKCRDHVLKSGEPWDRTYFAQHGKDCPYQVRVEWR